MVQVSRNDLLRLDLTDKKGNPELVLIRKDNEIYVYNYSVRSILRTSVVRPSEKKARDFDFSGPMLRFLVKAWAQTLSGPAPGDAPSQFALRLKEDEHYYYFWLLPQTSEPTVFPFPKGDFDRVRIALNKKTFLLREVYAFQSNGNSTRWLMENVRANLTPPITKESISQNLPVGFKVFDPKADTTSAERP